VTGSQYACLCIRFLAGAATDKLEEAVTILIAHVSMLLDVLM